MCARSAIRWRARRDQCGAVRGRGNNGGRSMLNKKVLIAGVILFLSTSAALAQVGPGARAILRGCKPDIARFCSQVPPGEGRVKACMKEHLHELSEPCKRSALPSVAAPLSSWVRQTCAPHRAMNESDTRAIAVWYSGGRQTIPQYGRPRSELLAALAARLFT